MKNILTVNTSKTYNIYIKENILKEIPTILQQNYQVKEQIFIVCDIILKNTYAHILLEACKLLQIKPHIIYIESTEKNKNFQTVNDICNIILNNNCKRNTAILSLGGGIIGDIAGFCASILLRGIPYFQIPTTLLSQVDSSIGGKTGVNTLYSKNSIGSFYQPKAVFVDISTLNTLIDRDFFSGYAECIKYALLYSEQHYRYLDDNINNIIDRSSNVIKNIIYTSLRFKKNIVEKDEFETKNQRIFLNLGHTFAHAFEKYNNYLPNLTHGEAVAIGLLFAFAFAEENSICVSGEYQKIYNHLNKIGLPTNIKNIITNICPSTLVNLMKNDKKNNSEDISLILPQKIGSCIVYNASASKIEQFINNYLNSTCN